MKKYRKSMKSRRNIYKKELDKERKKRKKRDEKIKKK